MFHIIIIIAIMADIMAEVNILFSFFIFRMNNVLFAKLNKFFCFYN